MFVVGDHAAPVYSLAFSPAGGTLAGAGKDGTARLWDLAGGPAIVLNGHTDAVLSVAFHPDGTQVATGSADRTARLWDATTGKELFRLPGEHEAAVSRGGISQQRADAHHRGRQPHQRRRTGRRAVVAG